jgi:hypothetical protein
LFITATCTDFGRENVISTSKSVFLKCLNGEEHQPETLMLAPVMLLLVTAATILDLLIVKKLKQTTFASDRPSTIRSRIQIPLRATYLATVLGVLIVPMCTYGAAAVSGKIGRFISSNNCQITNA